MYRGEGGYNLQELRISKNGEDIDLRMSFVEISLYESIFDHFMTGSIMVVESFDMKNLMPITGTEIIDLKFSTLGNEDNPITFSGVVYDVGPDHEVSRHSSGYVIYFCSPGMVKSTRSYVMRGYNDTVTNIVKNIYDVHVGSEKLLDSVSSKGIEAYTFGSFKPTEAISCALSGAISNDNEVGYLFYENNSEFVCKPLEKLYKQEPYTLYYDKGINVFEDVDQRHVESFNSIQNVEYLQEDSFLNNVMDGNLGSTCVYLDLPSKSYREVKYDVAKDFKESNSLGRFPLKRNDLVNDTHQDTRILNVSCETKVDLCFRDRFVQQEIHKHKHRFVAFGDSSIKAGMTCEAYLPKLTALNNEAPNTVSGKFLITEIKHTLTNRQYMQTIMIQKNAYEERV